MPGSSQIPAFLFLSLLLLDTFAIIPNCCRAAEQALGGLRSLALTPDPPTICCVIALR